MDKLLKDLEGKSIHIVGVTGAEGSNILRLLVKHNIKNITTHDFLAEGTLEKSFRTWHKGITLSQKREQFRRFINDLSKIKFYSGTDYLKDIASADIIFVPQSWRLYKKHNQPLWAAKKKGIPFYSLTRLYLDFAPAQIIAVTGTVGKGSVANLLYKLLEKIGKKVYFAGNETWMVQIADRLEEMSKKDILVLEISHRQLQDGWNRPPTIIIITNLYPNHLDELDWQEYQLLKLSFVKSQTPKDISVINYDVPELRETVKKFKSKTVFFSTENKKMNTKNIQKYFQDILHTKNAQYPENLLATFTTLDILGIDLNKIIENVSKTIFLPARLEFLGEFQGISLYDDIKSTTPWATSAAIKKLSPGVILICGGRTKGIDYRNFVKDLRKVKFVIMLESELSRLIGRLLPKKTSKIVKNFDEALKLASEKANRGDKIVVSPAAGFFYSDFIRGKIPLRKLLTGVVSKSSEDHFSSSRGAN